MSVHVQLLQDAETPDGTQELLKLAMWLREHDQGLSVGNHYNWECSTNAILDLGELVNELTTWFQEKDEGWKDGETPPPDIRDWLRKQIAAGRTLAWVSF